MHYPQESFDIANYILQILGKSNTNHFPKSHKYLFSLQEPLYDINGDTCLKNKLGRVSDDTENYNL